MESSAQDSTSDEIARLRHALDAETERCIQVQGKLDQARAEFEEFVSLSAHNLRESLREVTAYSELMAKTYAGRLDSEAAEYLGRIEEGAASMQSLLTDVVDYWAAGAAGRPFSSTDMEAVLHQALLLAEKQIAERDVTVTHDPMPLVTGNFETLAKVLRHLIGNAIAYCCAPDPRVSVSCKRVGPEWVFSVEDNGPGIEPAFQERIFGPFKRLHGKEYPGNGLGLAFCRKAIEWHGGRMWVESAPGAGSKFYFTLEPSDLS
jgi:light-regulated signal transduction histidine kinase (bacteriophytochrome)